MDRHISATDAKRQFPRLLSEVRAGASYTVTSHGHPVARIVPHLSDTEARIAAWEAHLARLLAAPAQAVMGWSREELYDELLSLTG